MTTTATAPRFITVRTRTGNKAHLATPGGASTECGVWLRVDSRLMEVGGDVTCESCGTGPAPAAAPVQEEAPVTVSGWAAGDEVQINRPGAPTVIATVIEVAPTAHGEVRLTVDVNGRFTTTVHRRPRA